MERSLRTSLLAFLFPGGVICLAALGFLRPHGLPDWLQPPLAALPYITLGFGLVFGWYLDSSRMILALIVLALADRGLALFPPYAADSGSEVVFNATAFLLPLNLLALSLTKEDGVSTVRGATRVLIILSQPFLVLWLSLPEQSELASSLDLAYVPRVLSDWTPIPQTALLAFGVAIGMQAARFVVRKDPWEGGFVWALLTLFFAYHGTRYGWRPSNFVAASGLILFISLLQASYRRTYRDDLTGLPGRQAYDETVAGLGDLYSVAVIGLDQLKQYKNVHGRIVGDQLLRLIAPTIAGATVGGRIFRLGGEELTCLFPGLKASETLVTLDRMRKAVEGTTFVLNGKDSVREIRKIPGDRPHTALPLSVSIGVADRSTPSGSHDQVVRGAYRALYEAKAEGGNIVKRGTLHEPVGKAVRTTGRIVAGGEYEF